MNQFRSKFLHLEQLYEFENAYIFGPISPQFALVDVTNSVKFANIYFVIKFTLAIKHFPVYVYFFKS